MTDDDRKKFPSDIPRNGMFRFECERGEGGGGKLTIVLVFPIKYKGIPERATEVRVRDHVNLLEIGGFDMMGHVHE